MAAALLNPTARRLAVAASRRLSTPPAVEPLAANWIAQGSPSRPPPPHSPLQPSARRHSSLVEVNGGFGEMVAGPQRFYVFGGKGGVGKTSLAASLAVKFAKHGEPTLLVSTHPSHSLSDALEQDLSGGQIVPVDGVDSLFVAELVHANPLDDERSSSLQSLIRDTLGKMKLGELADPLGTNKLHEVLMKIPGLVEGIAALKLVDIIESPESNKFRRIVLDTGGHTLNPLSAANLMEKIFIMGNKVVNAAPSNSLLKLLLAKGHINPAVIEELRQQITRVRDLMQDPQSTEFLIVTIPSVMAIMESSRFHASLKKDGAPATRLIVNQVLPPPASECRFWAVKRKEETRALNMISADHELGGLKLIQAPLQDVEVKGVPALRFFSEVVWK